MRNNMEALVALAAILVAAPATVALRVFTLATLWRWFLVPLGVAEIGAAHALGISALLYLMHPSKQEDTPEGAEAVGLTLTMVLRAVVKCGAALLLGLIATTLMAQ